MHDRDSLHRFLFEQFPIRGHLVHLDAAWRALIEHREYPQAIRDTLGEAVAASLLLAATVKFDGVLSLQLQGAGPMHLMLVQCTSGLGVRGLARYRDADAAGLAGIGDLIGDGNLTVTVETDAGAQRYQGIVPIAGTRLAEALQSYFENSEQLPTRLWLHADAQGASGMLLQKLPGASSAAPKDAVLIEDAWRRVQLIAETLTAEELRSLADAEIIVDIVRELRSIGPNMSRPTIRACVAIGRILALRQAHALPDDPVFRWACRDVLSSETAKVTRAGHTALPQKIEEAILKGLRSAKPGLAKQRGAKRYAAHNGTVDTN